MTKMCSKCKVEKDLSSFYKDKHSKTGYVSACKTCTLSQKRDKYSNVEPVEPKVSEQQCTGCGETKLAIEFNKNRRSKTGLNTRCKICRNKVKNLWRANNSEVRQKAQDYARNYYYDNKAECNRRTAEWKKRKRIEDPSYKLRCYTSSAIWDTLTKRDRTKAESCWSALPYSADQLREHLEAQFDEHMTWDNYGDYWHVDHVYPQSLLPYDSYDDPNFQKCWALENLQPLEKIENIKKSNKIK